MNRDKCVICENNKLQLIYTRYNMPITFSPVDNNDISSDIYDNQNWLVCNNCGCVQLKNLINPDILYGNTHNLTYNLPLWSEHHSLFSKFILENIKNDSIMEVGGSSGVLYNKLKDSNIKYSCIDLCKANFDTSNITYEISNCENYKFNTDTIVASHLFEHLYEPNNFIKNLSKCNVKSVFISIPNMKVLLEKSNPYILNYEHTYYVDKYYIEYMFIQEGYTLHNYYEFKNHSLFFMFEKTPNIKLDNFNLINKISIKDIFLNINNTLIHNIKNTNILPNSFIIPGGYLGQLIYSINKPDSLFGFLDNDISKHNKRLYGTPYYMYSFDKLNEYNYTVNVYIFGGPYTNEIINQLQNYKNINIHIINIC